MQNDVTSVLNNRVVLNKIINYFTSLSWRSCKDNPHLIESLDRYLRPHLSSENTTFVVHSISKTLNLLKPIWCLISELDKVVHQNWKPGDISSIITPAIRSPVFNSLEKLIQLDNEIRDSINEIIEGMIEFVSTHGNYKVAKLTPYIKNIIEKDQYPTLEEKDQIMRCIEKEPSPALLFVIWRIFDCYVGNLNLRFYKISQIPKEEEDDSQVYES